MATKVEKRGLGDFYGIPGVSLVSNGFRYTESTYMLDERLPVHEHEHPHFCYVLSGGYEERLGCQGFKTATRESADILFLPAGIPHAEVNHAPSRRLMLEALPERIASMECIVGQPLKLPPEEPLMFMHKAYREYTNPEPDSEFVLEGLALLLFGSLQKSYRLASQLNSYPAWLRNTRARMDHEFLRPWTLDTLSHEAGIDPEHLTSQFSRIFGATPAEYLRKRRVRYACQLIQTSDMPLPEVALSAGFADQAHFSRTFRYHMGVTPLFFLRCVRGLARTTRPLPLRKAKLDQWDEHDRPEGQRLLERKVGGMGR